MSPGRWLSCVHVAAAMLVGGSSVAQPYGDEEADRRARIWRQQGSKALPSVVDSLCSEESDPHVRARAREWLVELGAPAVPPLLKMSTDERCASVEIAESILPQLLCAAPMGRARMVFSPIAVALSSKQDARALAALNVIRWTSVNDPCPAWPAIASAAVKPAVKLLGRVERARKAEVMVALGSLGSAAAPAVPKLIPWLDDPELREPAMELLGDIGAASAPAAPRLIELLGDPETRAAAVQALGQIPASAHTVLPMLISWLPRNGGDTCRRPDLPSHVLIGAIGSLVETEQGRPLREAARRELTLTRRLCPRYEPAIAHVLGRLSMH